METVDLKALEDAVLSDLETLKFHRKIAAATHLYHRCRLLACPMETILGLVGHADSDMSEHYLHLQESVRQDAIGRFAKRFADAEAA